jgi:hypothetical protein
MMSAKPRLVAMRVRRGEAALSAFEFGMRAASRSGFLKGRSPVPVETPFVPRHTVFPEEI